MTSKILITGANGQLGSVLTKELQVKYGIENIIASDLKHSNDHEGNFEIIDATNVESIYKVVKKYKISQIYHLAAVLSANGEKNPINSWYINTKALLNVLEVTRDCKIEKVFFPSSIAVFGDHIDPINTSNFAYLNPATAYGMSKAAGENWCNYYHLKYDLDIRSLRYPGVIGYQSLPGGGTTDYAVEVFHSAVKQEPYRCFLKDNAKLPMIFMEDAIRATIEIMEAPRDNINIRTSYNLAGSSFSPKEITDEICKYYPNFKIEYKPDFRQVIAEKWPQSINDEWAQSDWNWKPEYDLKNIVFTMITKLKEQYKLTNSTI